MKCTKCGLDMRFLKTTVNARTGRPADLYRCDRDDIIISVEKEA